MNPLLLKFTRTTTHHIAGNTWHQDVQITWQKKKRQEPKWMHCSGIYQRAGFMLRISRKVLSATSFLDPDGCQLPGSLSVCACSNENRKEEYQWNTFWNETLRRAMAGLLKRDILGPSATPSAPYLSWALYTAPHRTRFKLKWLLKQFLHVCFVEKVFECIICI